MQLPSLLGHAQELLLTIRNSDRPADSLIDTFFRSRKYLGSRDRRFLAETTYGTLRHLRRCEVLLWKGLEGTKAEIGREDGFLLVIVTYLIAVVRKTDLLTNDVVVKLQSPLLKELAPDLLQRLSSPEMVPIQDPVERLGVLHSFPDWLVERFIREYGEEEAEKMLASLNEQAPITLRVNTLKTTVEECRKALQREEVETTPTGLSPFGLELPKRANIFQMQAFRDGFFEVQDEGSQLLPLLIDPKPTAKLLDACAGAGGKTLAFAALMKNRGEIVATDVNKFRLEELRKRARRGGVFNVRSREIADVVDLVGDQNGTFDVVFLDAPCSGLGTIRRNPGMKWTVTEETISELSAKQRHILESAAPLVKKGGRLVYATCTFLREENEEVVEDFLRRSPGFSPLPPEGYLSKWNLLHLASGSYIRLLPHRDGTDGFFCAVLERNS